MPEQAALHRWLERRWYGSTAPWLLRPLAALYGLVVRIRCLAYARGWLRSLHPGVPVIVVGNLTVGGTGKTPLVLWLAAALREAGQRPGVALRGYGGRQRQARLVTVDDTADQVGDEAVLISRRSTVPVAVGADRVVAAQLLARQGCTVVLCDDGLQHLALRRDLAIAVVDGKRGFGNGALLPAGPLREPITILDAMDLLVVTGEDLQQVTKGLEPISMTLVPGSLRSLTSGQTQPLEALQGKAVHAVAGIGHPLRFFALLASLGARPIGHAFADHHPYLREELEFGDALPIVMTEKDAVRCAAFAHERMWYLPVTASFSEPDATRLLRSVLAKIPGGGNRSA